MGRVFRTAERRFAPWKNGGGETAEVLCVPPGAGYDFDWRISTARVDRSGGFSTFPGVDRVLTVLEGGAMTLAFAGRSVLLDAAAGPFAFAGDASCHATLLGGGLLDLNVMVRRPLRAEVLGPGRPVDGPARARYLFALTERADLGLERHALMDLAGAPLPATVPEATLLIEILDPR